MIIEILTGMLALAGLLNVWATYRAVRDDLSSTWQRAAHVLLIWALPVIGALLVLYLYRAQPERASGAYATESELGAELGEIGKGLRPTGSAGLNSARDLDD